VFTLFRPAAAAVEAGLAAAGKWPPRPLLRLSLRHGKGAHPLPVGYAHDRSRSCLGRGAAPFEAARRGFKRWAMFDLGWVRVANPRAGILPGEIVAVEAHTLGLWTVNYSRIVETIDAATCFGFLYATTGIHVEAGEERFLLRFDPETEEVWYEIEAISRPHAVLAMLGYPVTRRFQRRFARDSHVRMREVVEEACG